MPRCVEIAVAAAGTGSSPCQGGSRHRPDTGDHWAFRSCALHTEPLARLLLGFPDHAPLAPPRPPPDPFARLPAGLLGSPLRRRRGRGAGNPLRGRRVGRPPGGVAARGVGAARDRGEGRDPQPGSVGGLGARGGGLPASPHHRADQDRHADGDLAAVARRLAPDLRGRGDGRELDRPGSPADSRRRRGWGDHLDTRSYDERLDGGGGPARLQRAPRRRGDALDDRRGRQRR